MKGKKHDPQPNPFNEIAQSVAKTSDAIWFQAIIQFTQTIAKRMADCGLNRVQLAKLLDVHPSFITKVLKGDTNITIETIARLTHALNCDFQVHVIPKESLVGKDFELEKQNQNTNEAAVTASLAFLKYIKNCLKFGFLNLQYA